jgi:hypothetical protein
MTNRNEIAVSAGADSHPIALSPREVLRAAEDQANALMDLVEKRKLFQVVGGKKYLHAEAWITIGAFNQIVAQTDWIAPERNDANEITGYDAKVSLIHTPTGEVRGGAIMSCGLDSFPCRGKHGSEKHKAAKSAAQTWAVSKAFRMTHSYVPVLAGYEATPAEEMSRDEGPPPQPRPIAPRSSAPNRSPAKAQTDVPVEAPGGGGEQRKVGNAIADMPALLRLVRVHTTNKECSATAIQNLIKVRLPSEVEDYGYDKAYEAAVRAWGESE